MKSSAADIEYQLVRTEERVGDSTFSLWGLESFEAASASMYGQLRGAGSPRLRDDLSPMFGVIWGSARVLAEWVQRADLRGKRVLELGCGLALPSLVAARGGADVLATDQHPDTGELLQRNAGENGLAVAYQTLDWRDPVDVGRFDLVIAADVMFARELPGLVVGAFAQTLSRRGTGWLADPGRAWVSETHAAAEAHGLALEVEVDEVRGEEAFVFCLSRA